MNIHVNKIIGLVALMSGWHYQPTTSHWYTLSHIVVSSTPRHKWDLNPQL